jgi:hypothetical protein
LVLPLSRGMIRYIREVGLSPEWQRVSRDRGCSWNATKYITHAPLPSCPTREPGTRSGTGEAQLGSRNPSRYILVDTSVWLTETVLKPFRCFPETTTPLKMRAKPCSVATNVPEPAGEECGSIHVSPPRTYPVIDRWCKG